MELKAQIFKYKNRDKAKECFVNSGFKVSLGHRYLGGFVGSKQEETKWIEQGLFKNFRKISDYSSISSIKSIL